MIIPIIPLIHRTDFFRRPFKKRLRRKPSRVGKLILLPIATTFMALSSCNDEDTRNTTPQVTVTDTEPVGAGLTVIGFAIVGAAVVVVLGRLLR